MAAEQAQDDDIRKFEEIGTHPAANHNAISEALIFNENLGIDRKAARLRYLRDRWAKRLAQQPEVPHPAQLRPGAIAAASASWASMAWTPGKCMTRCGASTTSSPR